MSLQLILGSAGSGKTHVILNEILQEALSKPDGKFFVIVPEQFTMQTQQALTRMHPHGAILNIDVLSFERLAYRVFDEVGYKRKTILEETGKSFILQKIVLSYKKTLPTFGGKLEKPGSIAEMKSVLSELDQYLITPDKMHQAAENCPADLLRGKLEDIETVYRDYKTYLEEHARMTAEEAPDILCDVIGRSELLKDSVLAFDGFTGFTPVQNKLIRQLLPLVSRILVTVTFDIRKDPRQPLPETDIFWMSSVMIRKLWSVANDAGAKVEPYIILSSDDKSRFGTSEPLRFLESHLFRYRGEVYNGENEDIRVSAGHDPYDEIAEVSRIISRLVRKEGYLYRDFAVITGDLPTYGNIIRQIFTDDELPFFIDEKRPLSGNPFIEYLRAALEACAENYSYDSVFRMLKTGMTDLSEDELMRLENYVLAMGIRGKKKWRSQWAFHFRGEDPAEVPMLNEVKKKVLILLDPLSDMIAKRGATVEDKTEALYTFCIKSRIQEKLKVRENEFQTGGRPDLAREYAQVYGKIMSLLDKLVDVLGDETVSMSDYRMLLETGFSEEKIGIIPPSDDQIIIGDMERSRLRDIKVLFFVGVNDGKLPRVPGEGCILTESDRAALTDRGLELRPSVRQAIYVQNYYLYLSLTKPSEKLFLTYPVSDSGGAELSRAYLTDEILRLFPDIKVTGTNENSISKIERPEDGLSYIADGLLKLKDEAPSDEWMELYGWYLRNATYNGRVRKLLDAAMTKNPHDQIGRAVAKALYGDVLFNSVSRLERFAACAFSHFAQYGLNLKEREEFSFAGMDRGNVMHSALELFAERLAKDGRDWADLSDDERDELAESCVLDASGTYNAQILKSSARNEYQIRRMVRFMKTTVWAIQQQLICGDFRPREVEKAFGDRILPSSEIDLGDGMRMTLKGRIDRIDVLEADGKTYLKIIDYKTGQEAFSFAKIYYGLQLQLVLYLNEACKMTRGDGKIAEPAGIFYYEIKDPIVKLADASTDEELKESILRDLRVSGIVSSDRYVIRHLDRTLGEDHMKSNVIPVALKKGNELAAVSRTVSAEDFRNLENYVSKKLKSIGTKIMEGDASVNPYSMNDKTDACIFCPYKGVCGFDSRIPGYEFTNFEDLKPEEALGKMREDI